MELNQLWQFKILAESKTMTEAAERLHISQPALSFSLNKLAAAQQLPEHKPATPMVYRELVTNRLCLAAVH